MRNFLILSKYFYTKFFIFYLKRIQFSFYCHLGCSLCRFAGSSTTHVLNDKSHLAVSRESYRQYENETPSTYPDLEEGEERGNLGAPMGTGAGAYEFDQYSDEYDDTYDSHMIGAVDNDSSEEVFTLGR